MRDGVKELTFFACGLPGKALVFISIFFFLNPFLRCKLINLKKKSIPLNSHSSPQTPTFIYILPLKGHKDHDALAKKQFDRRANPACLDPVRAC